jgi:hypothetical protein
VIKLRICHITYQNRSWIKEELHDFVPIAQSGGSFSTAKASAAKEPTGRLKNTISLMEQWNIPKSDVVVN